MKKVAREILKYTVFFEPAKEGGFVASVPALPGCFSQGETFEETSREIEDAIGGYLAVLQAEKQKIPQEKNLIIGQVSVAYPSYSFA